MAGFLSGRIRFGGISAILEEALTTHEARPVDTLETVLDADRQARELAVKAMRKHES